MDSHLSRATTIRLANYCKMYLVSSIPTSTLLGLAACVLFLTFSLLWRRRQADTPAKKGVREKQNRRLQVGLAVYLSC
jgi:hypothetical protein